MLKHHIIIEYLQIRWWLNEVVNTEEKEGERANGIEKEGEENRL